MNNYLIAIPFVNIFIILITEQGKKNAIKSNNEALARTFDLIKYSLSIIATVTLFYLGII